MESTGGRRSSFGADSWRAPKWLPAADADRTESIVESKDFPALRGGLATAAPDKPVPHNPPAAKHTNICLRPPLAMARVLLRADT
jgi:hypothetical protein